MSDNDHIDAQWLRAAQSPPPPPRRRGFGCALSLLVLILVLAGVLFYPRVQALLTPVPTVQIQMESSVLPDTAPNCAANPRGRRAARRCGQTVAAVTFCDAARSGLYGRAARLAGALGALYGDGGGLNAHITVTFDWVYPDDGPARHAELARTADGLLAAAPAEDYPRALYLYDWLLEHVRYVPRETYDQTAYAAVCEGEAVCGGIADAYVYLLERGGIPARVVTGTSLSADGTADSHAWVAAELDGAVYYFDPTWDLQDDESEAALPDYLSHTWFALTAERMAVRHTAEDPTLWPDSRANADNYYVRNGYTAVEASVAAAAAAVRSQWDDGRARAGFRCETPEVYAGMQSLPTATGSGTSTARLAATCPRPATTVRGRPASSA
ncbi:MAG: transglutaminase domain-containing protein [Oscillospiraceae bacterium]